MTVLHIISCLGALRVAGIVIGASLFGSKSFGTSVEVVIPCPFQQGNAKKMLSSSMRKSVKRLRTRPARLRVTTNPQMRRMARIVKPLVATC